MVERASAWDKTHTNVTCGPQLLPWAWWRSSDWAAHHLTSDRINILLPSHLFGVLSLFQHRSIAAELSVATSHAHGGPIHAEAHTDKGRGILKLGQQ